jgi:protein phosphatase
MGGHKAGEVASNAALTASKNKISQLLQTGAPQTPAAAIDIVTQAINCANEVTFELAKTDDESFGGMGTTLLIAYFADEFIVIANVGDSRAYTINSTEIKQVTIDNSLETLTDTGKKRIMLTRAVGSDYSVEIDTYTLTNLPNDTYILLCSDGLYNEVCDFELEQLIKNGADASRLTQVANERGGHDNITAIVGEIK